ncbi:MAG: membrane protein insertase YidC [Deltaproteobacteria bacterium]|nr:membrane protein insertase YidC [Deltaproteobacteria bacterium]MBW1957062.1 membrane protein insertase YidC [Deltaproteobacteria bacterium]MBW2087562.1 membrane protein insertase YidC [Deltaproteobacteria bacterium]MBW2319453.1 membrane protein insertase YidC [Deltaproteobacteria bacterium]
MDQARLVIAIALSLLVFIVWNFFFVKKKVNPPPKQAQQKEQTKDKKSEILTKEQNTAEKLPSIDKVPALPVKPSRTVTVKTPLYKIQISEKGAVFKSVVLNNYREIIDADSPLLEMISPDISGGTIRLGFAGNSLTGLDDAIFLAGVEEDSVDIIDKPKEISFVWTSPQGMVVEKKFLFSPETYMIDFGVTIKNLSSKTLRDNLTLTLVRKEEEKKSRYGFTGPSALINNKLKQIKTKKIKDQSLYTGNIKWVAVQNRYFMSAIIPDETTDAGMQLYVDNKILQNRYVGPESVIESGTKHVFKYKLFFGPKSMKILNRIDFDLVKAVHFGMFDIIAKPCVWIMNFIYDHFIPNYGIAIIILTLFTKIILWPLGNKSYKSMAEMKKIQPLMAEIKEKYKDDKKRMNEEMMGLYKTYKVNPMGGCLPMVAQIPIFFALYRMLYEAIELRHAPFFWWINDLSAPDRLFRFDVSIPFMQPPYGIPVLTIIMGASMFIQQKMSPPMGDPAQAKMMMLMPLVFTVMFINFSSGLVLYWLVNNVISMAQQYYIQKKKV